MKNILLVEFDFGLVELHLVLCFELVADELGEGWALVLLEGQAQLEAGFYCAQQEVGWGGWVT